MRGFRAWLAAGALLTGACALHDEPALTAAERARYNTLCRNMTEHAPAVRGYPEIVEGTPLDTLAQAHLRLDKAMREVKKASPLRVYPRVQEVAAAYEELREEVESLAPRPGEGPRPGDGPARETLDEAKDSVAVDFGRLRDTWDGLYLRLGCGA